MPVRLIGSAALLLFLAGCGESTIPTDPSPAGSNVSIVSGAQTLTTTAFNPNSVTIASGMTITWMNNDSIEHTTTANAGAWDSGRLAPGASFSRTFTTVGTFPYHCSIHPDMVATVIVQ